MSAAVQGGLLGAVASMGVLLVLGHFRARRITLEDRLAPYLRPARTTSKLLTEGAVQTPLATVQRLLQPWMADAVRLVSRVGAPAELVRARLVRAGRATTVEQFRAEQVVGAVLGLLVGLLLALLALVGRGVPLPSLLVVVTATAIGGMVLPDVLLQRQVAAREVRLLAELPAVAELLALSVSAGEGAVGALERVTRTTRGELSTELARTLAEARSGTPLTVALENLADRVRLAPLTRFAQGVAVAVERGTPLADVLRSQAQDVREAGRRALMESGGRKEVTMMVPVVFLVLPVTVVFAIFPGFTLLQVGL